MKTIGAAQFKEHCLRILDTLGPEGIVVTKHGKPVAKITKIEEEAGTLIGALKGKLKIKNASDLLSTKVKWNAES